jgi:hypothetical protein
MSPDSEDHAQRSVSPAGVLSLTIWTLRSGAQEPRRERGERLIEGVLAGW